MANPLLIPSLIMGGSGILASLLGKKKTSQQPLETEEQRKARESLYDFAKTGRLGDFKAGEEQPLGYGDYTPTTLESQGQSTLQNLLSGGIPPDFALGDAALKDFLMTDPMDVSAQYNPFKDTVNRQISESESALKRASGFAGNLYSTDTVRKLGDIQARGNETLTSQLANLTNESLNRRLSAIPLAYRSAEAKQSAGLQQVAASQQYGDLVRRLNDQQIKARDTELLRRRTELQMPIEALKSVAGQGSNFGIPSISSSPYQDLLSMVGKIGGQYIGNELAMGQYKRYFPNNEQPNIGSSPLTYTHENKLNL